MMASPLGQAPIYMFPQAMQGYYPMNSMPTNEAAKGKSEEDRDN
jgi:hypothetical protein